MDEFLHKFEITVETIVRWHLQEESWGYWVVQDFANHGKPLCVGICRGESSFQDLLGGAGLRPSTVGLPLLDGFHVGNQGSAQSEGPF